MHCNSVRGCRVCGEVIGDRTQLDNVANGAHDEETDANSLAKLQELLLVSCRVAC